MLYRNGGQFSPPLKRKEIMTTTQNTSTSFDNTVKTLTLFQNTTTGNYSFFPEWSEKNVKTYTFNTFNDFWSFIDPIRSSIHRRQNAQYLEKLVEYTEKKAANDFEKYAV